LGGELAIEWYLRAFRQKRDCLHRIRAGVYQIVGPEAPVFRPVAAPESSDLQELVEQIAGMQCLHRIPSKGTGKSPGASPAYLLGSFPPNPLKTAAS
jgi:hypothetical protein